MKRTGLIILTILMLSNLGFAQTDSRNSDEAGLIGMVKVPSGEYQAFLKENGKVLTVQVPSFYLDKHAVTNKEFLAFVQANPQWSRSRVPAVLADRNYLKDWESDFVIGNPAIENSPVTDVSWYAAEAYAKWLGKRLPTIHEWEYAAKASPVGESDIKDLTRYVLDWYAKRGGKDLPSVKSTYENDYGLYDMFGLVWEWTLDFNSVMLGGDSRSGGTVDANLFCATGSLVAADKTDYAAFMRFAFRSSLKASYTIHNLGFRCAKDIEHAKTEYQL